MVGKSLGGFETFPIFEHGIFGYPTFMDLVFPFLKLGPTIVGLVINVLCWRVGEGKLYIFLM